VAGDPSRSPYWPVCAFSLSNHDAGCAGCAQYDGRECFWGGAEYLVWWVKDSELNVPLLTTSGPASLGILGNTDTRVLFGNDDLNYEAFSGARFTLGIWLDKQGHGLGLEGTGFFLERRTDEFQATSAATGAPVLARPFLNPIANAQDAALVSAPGQFAGSIGIGSSSSLYGFETNFVRPTGFTMGGARVDLLAGFRYLNLTEDLSVYQTSALLEGGTAGFAGAQLTSPATLDIIDRFQTRNEFYGGQIGARAEYRSGRLMWNARGKLAFGNVHEVVSIDGATRVFGPVAPDGGVLPATTVPGGLLAVSSNIGRSARDRFAFVPEFGFNVGYQLKQTVSIFMGYTFLWWGEVARPGDQISNTINPTLVPSSLAFGLPFGPAQPTAVHEGTDYWAQGLNFGIEFRY
jgi:hypothetical protein